MVYGAAQLVRERGVTATGVRDVVDRAGAPRGSFQHYFPGGKDQLIGQALLWSGGYAADWVARYAQTARHPTPAGLFAHLVSPWTAEFHSRGYARGCPVQASAADLAAGDSPVNVQVRAAYDTWEQAVAAELARQGVPRRRAARLASVMLSALEGAIMAARIRRDARPLAAVVSELGPLLDAALP
jgi:AcrR family transcriptional regulator